MFLKIQTNAVFYCTLYFQEDRARQEKKVKKEQRRQRDEERRRWREEEEWEEEVDRLSKSGINNRIQTVLLCRYVNKKNHLYNRTSYFTLSLGRCLNRRELFRRERPKRLSRPFVRTYTYVLYES